LLFTAYSSKICSANCSTAFRDFVATFRIPPKTASNGLVIPIFVSSKPLRIAFFTSIRKLHAAGSRESSFRTFYFEPRITTNKVRDDAVHLLLGFSAK